MCQGVGPVNACPQHDSGYHRRYRAPLLWLFLREFLMSVPTVRAAVFVITGRGLRKPMMSWQELTASGHILRMDIVTTVGAITNSSDQFGQGNE